MPFSSKRNQNSLEKWLLIGLGQGIYKVILEYLTVSGNKKILKRKPTMMGHRSQLKALPMANARTI